MDSPERAQNLDLVVEQLMALKDSIRMEIRILEADEHPHYELKISDEHIHKTFVRDASPVFHRTKYLNQLMQEAEGSDYRYMGYRCAASERANTGSC